MSLLTAQIVKKSHISAGIYMIFLKNALHQTWMSFNTKFRPQWKDQKSSYPVGWIWTLFLDVVLQIVGWNCVMGLRVAITVK